MLKNVISKRCASSSKRIICSSHLNLRAHSTFSLHSQSFPKKNGIFQQIRPISSQAIENSANPSQTTPAIIFDIDGVLMRGGTTIPPGDKTFQKIYDQTTEKFKLPVIFVTNAGNTTTELKAQQLSNLLNCKITEDQVVLAHTPFKSLEKDVKSRFTLVSGQGPVEEIAKSLGFENTITIDQVREMFLYLDMVDTSTRPVTPKIFKMGENDDKRLLPKIEQVLLFSEPRKWERSLQIIIDTIITNGDLWQQHSQEHFEKRGILNPKTPTSHQLPVLISNLDLQWLPEAPGPRFAHGIFANILESTYKKITGGKELQYAHLSGKPAKLTYQYAEQVIDKLLVENFDGKKISNIYCIGDNLMSDVYGANLYKTSGNRPSVFSQNSVYAKTTSIQSTNEGGLNPQTPKTHFKSMLVCTGVYHVPQKYKNALKSDDQMKEMKSQIKSININHAPRDYQEFILKNKKLLQPDYLFEDVFDCVNFIFEKEKVDDRDSI